MIFDDSYTRYGKKRMIEMGIPFVFGNEDIYLPFMGVVLMHKRNTTLPDVEKFSPATQKMVLTAFYERWNMISAKEISNRLQFSRMTAGRCLMELQSLGLPLVEIKGKTKYYVFSGARKMLYELCKPYFINPVAKTYLLKEIPDNVHCLGGISVLAHYSRQAFELSGDANTLTPMHMGDEISSLSAILLNDVYYRMLLDGKTEIDGVVVLAPAYIVLFKVKAWLDLSEKRKSGLHVDGKDIKKHKNDVIRLATLLSENDNLVLPDEVKADMALFIAAYEEEPADLKSLGITGLKNEDINK